MNKNTIFGATTFGIQDVAGATVAPQGNSEFTADENNILVLASQFGVAVPNMPLEQMSTHARAEAFGSVESALKKVMMESPAGRELLGGAIIEPLRTEQDYKSTLRAMFKPYVLGAGQENWIPLDVDVQAFIVSMDGEKVTQTPYGLDGVEAPLQKIETEVLFHLTDIRKGKFDLIGRSKEKAESEVFKVEDARIANLLEVVAKADASPDIMAVKASEFKKTGLATIIAAVGELEGQVGITLNATSLWCNPFWKQVFRSMSNYANGYQVSFNTADELVKKGIVAEFQGLSINTSSAMKRENIFITAEPETFGGFVESTPLMVIDTVQGSMVGFIILEEVGMVVSNPKGLATIVINMAQ